MSKFDDLMRKYDDAEDKTDSVIRRLADRKWTLAIIVVVVLALVIVVALK